jgi:hypothetical protein
MAAETFPAVVEKLGSPLEPGDYHRIPREGSLDPAGEAIEFEVSGPKGEGVLRCVAVKAEDWNPTKITITLPSGDVINVPDPPPRSADAKNSPKTE